MDDLFKKFLEFEKNYCLFEMKTNDFNIWTFLRVEIYRLLKMDIDNNPYNPVYNRQVLKNNFSQECYELICRNSASKDVLLFTPKHRLLNTLSHTICPHEEILKEAGINYYRLDLSYFCNNVNDEFEFCFKSSEKGFSCFEYNSTIQHLLDLIINNFNIQKTDEFILRYKKLIEYVYEMSKNYYGFKQFLLVTKPKTIALSSAYSIPAMFLITAAHKLNIKAIEFQHGLIDNVHIAYNSLCSNINQMVYPDCLFTYGEFDQAIPNHIIKKVIVLGNWYLDVCKLTYKCEKKKRVTIIDDIDTPECLCFFALQAAKALDGYEIIYRVHPESNLSIKKIKRLEKMNIRLSYKNDDLYELLSSSLWVVGVRSTALFEALCFNCNVRVLITEENDNCTGEAFKYLKKCNSVEIIKEIIGNSLDNDNCIHNIFYGDFNADNLVEGLRLFS